MAHLKPDPRFNEYEEVEDDKGNAIGFKLKDVDFFFKYNSEGGWKNQNGNVFNADGVLVEKEEDWGVDDDNIDEMENLLIDEEGDDDDCEENGEEVVPVVNKPNFDSQVLATVQSFRGTDRKIKIFIRSKSKIQSLLKNVQIKDDDPDKKNKIAQALKVVDIQQRKQLQEQLPKNAVINFSIQDQKRYWFGYVPVTAQQLFDTIQSIKNKSNFGILKTKTLWHLVNLSPTQATTKARQQLNTKITTLNKDTQVIIQISGLAPKSPLSYVLDLIQQCQVSATTIYKITLIGDKSAQIFTNIQSALLLTKLHQSRQQQGDLQVQVIASQNKIEEIKSYIIKMQKKKEFSPRTILQNQLLIANTVDGYLKIDLNAEIYVGLASLRRLLMYRGSDVLVPIGLDILAKK